MPWTKVYLSESEFEETAGLQDKPLRKLKYYQALREALSQKLKADPNLFIIGEGVDDAGGVFGTTLGLHKEFPDRVFDMPIAENGMTGIAIGAALAGMKPVFVHMRMDFLPVCMDQIVNHAAKWHYMFGGKVNLPLVIRSIIGRGWGSAAQHSQSLQAFFAHVPGLKVVMPATAYDAKGLLVSSIEDGNPIMFIEHRWLFGQIGYVPQELYTVPIGEAIVRKQGRDVTVAAVSFMVLEAVKAARQLESEGIDVEVVDLRTIKPLDKKTLLDSVRKTGRLVVADTGWKTGGISAEISASVSEEAFESLKAPIRRVALPDVPTPAGHSLEQAFYPDSQTIAAVVRKVIGADR